MSYPPPRGASPVSATAPAHASRSRLLDPGRTAVRNGNHPEAGVVLFTRAEMDAYIKSIRAGEFAELT